MVNSIATLKWDKKALARAMKLKLGQVDDYFKDGRRMSFLVERRLCNEVVGGQLAPTEKHPYDLEDRDGNRWEVRCLTAHGMYFGASNGEGSSRHFDEVKFLGKLRDIKGYIVADITKFPEVPIYKISSARVRSEFKKGALGEKAKSTSPAKIRAIFDFN